MKFETFEALIEYLRQFETWGDRGGFDSGGAVALLAAVLDCLHKNFNDGDLEELRDRLDENQVATLMKLASSVRV